MAKTGATTTVDKTAALWKAVSELTRNRVMVGVPDEGAGRKEGAITNAALAYIHENGAPEVNIPPRPFLKPTVRKEQAIIVKMMKSAGTIALSGKSPLPTFNALGLKISSAVKRTITAGIPPPLAASTVAGRIGRRKSGTWRAKRRAMVAANVAANKAPGEGIFTPLIDTGSLRNSITYVIRRAK